MARRPKSGRTAVSRLFRPRVLRLEDRTVPTAGALDPTFGTGGKVNFNFSFTDAVGDMALQSTGKIIVGGTTTTSSPEDFALARFNTNGTPDTSFGTGGRVQTDVGGPSDHLAAIAIQSDDKIIAAGSSANGQLGLVRYLANGGLDPSFGTGGIVAINYTDPINTASVALQPDGKIITAGGEVVGFNTYMSLTRFNVDGSLDTTFGTGGRFRSTVVGSASNVVLQPDGSMVMGGYSGSMSGSFNWAVARVLPTGMPDLAFGSNGAVTTTFSGFGNGDVRGLALQPDGRIVAAGQFSLNTNSQDIGAIVRYNPNGTLDKLWDGDGLVTVPRPGYETFEDVKIQPDGRIVAGGLIGNGGPSDTLLARFNNDGSLDATFGTAGLVTTDMAPGDHDQASIVLLQPDGKILTAGNNSGSDSNWLLGRYLPGDSILVSPRTGLTTTEAGASATFSVVLAQMPTDTVTIPLTMSVPGEGSLSAASLTFTPANALTPQTVTITGVDDPYDDGDISYMVQVGGTASTDADFNGVRGAGVVVTNLNNDHAGITVTPTSGLVTTETAGPPAQFTVVLNCARRAT